MIRTRPMVLAASLVLLAVALLIVTVQQLAGSREGSSATADLGDTTGGVDAEGGAAPDQIDGAAGSGPDTSPLPHPDSATGDAPEPGGRPAPSSSDAPPERDTTEPGTKPDAGDASEPRQIKPPGHPSDERELHPVTTIRGDISPKSIVSSHDGVFFAQNMMYRHTVTVYDRDHELLATIPDTVNLTDFGYDGPDADLRGSPVEMAFSPDGAFAYVSNYRMHGPGYGNGGTDTCSPTDDYDDSFVYRIDVANLAIDQVIPVGSVPKYVATTPDGRYVLVTNWCSYDLSIIATASGEEVDRIDIGRYPRGIAVTSDASTAYIAVMGSFGIATVDLASRSVDLEELAGIGRSPRHVVLGPDDRHLYVTLNGEGVVARVDLDTREVQRVTTGAAPRSMDIAADGRSLYVVNYGSDTVTKIRTRDMTVMQTIAVDERPIGITYDRATGEVWVAHYSGSIRVLQDR